MRHGSLFSGIGGFDLASAWMGWENAFQCEKDRFCQRVLQFYWPKAKLYGNIKEFNATIYRGLIDILTGGFPCQPFSHAGRRKGTADDRYLWPEMCRVIGEVRPRWFVGENVLGLLNWRRGLVFEQVLADLEDQGYTAWPYILPAAGVGAPHRRDRVWIIAYSGSDRRGRYSTAAQGSEGGNEKGLGQGNEPQPSDDNGDATYPNGLFRYERRMHQAEREASKRYLGAHYTRQFRIPWKNFPSQSPICCRDDGLSSRLDGIAFSKWRQSSIAAYGNAIVPLVALQIFRTIETLEKNSL
jgi:DNA (cytosine-5)-methyltransferase 1